MLVDAPSFASIANKPGQSIEAIAGHIVIPHAEMPRIKLSRDEIATLSAYPRQHALRVRGYDSERQLPVAAALRAAASVRG